MARQRLFPVFHRRVSGMFLRRKENRLHGSVVAAGTGARTDLHTVATTRATWRPLQIARVHETLVSHASCAAALPAPVPGTRAGPGAEVAAPEKGSFGLRTDDV
ncbi:hypothetical protein I6J71_08390 [Amycolatopsis sp. FDAARGOS 1241]|nr:hypothetical protein I6J71_08390 [Amycolatopsis sp. FDAARGOS 1241]